MFAVQVFIILIVLLLFCVEFGCNEVAGVCHEDAECVYDVDERKYKCQCNEGYSGDGVSCEQTDIGMSLNVFFFQKGSQ